MSSWYQKWSWKPCLKKRKINFLWTFFGSHLFEFLQDLLIHPNTFLLLCLIIVIFIVFHEHIWLNLLIHPKRKKEIWLHLLDSYSNNWPKRIIFNKYFLYRKLFIKYPRDIYLYYKIYSSLNFYYPYFIIKKNINY